MKLKTIRRSHRKDKKWDAVFEKEGREKVVPFGQKGYSDYTKHKNKTRKMRYLKRHSGMGEHWNRPDTPGALILRLRRSSSVRIGKVVQRS